MGNCDCCFISISVSFCVRLHQYQSEVPCLFHPRESTFPLTDGEDRSCLIPFQLNGTEEALFVVIVVSFVFIECEGGISPRIDTNLQRFVTLLGCELSGGSYRNDGSCPDKEGDGGEIDRNLNELLSLPALC